MYMNTSTYLYVDLSVQYTRHTRILQEYVYVDLHVGVCIYVYIYIYICVCVCAYGDVYERVHVCLI